MKLVFFHIMESVRKMIRFDPDEMRSNSLEYFLKTKQIEELIPFSIVMYSFANMTH
jgi:hypothetical protein